MSTPLVSLLIPCYNHEAFLADCLDSLLQQTYENIELLICDDCSPDGSFQVILGYEERLRQRFPRVEILRNSVNQGVTKNINRMLAMAKGAFVKTLASDDALAPDAIGEFVRFFAEHPQVDVAVANGRIVEECQHYPYFESADKIYPNTPDFSREGFFLRVARCNPISAPAAMVRMAVYERFGFYDESVKVEDFEFWLRILKDGAVSFGFLDKELLYYRRNGGSMTSTVNNAGLEKRRQVFHNAVMQSLYKYREYFPKGMFAAVAMPLILDELSFAVDKKMHNWEKALRQEWKAFPARKELSRCQQVAFSWRYLKIIGRKAIKT